MPLRLVTWNVNSLRSAIRQGFCEWLASTQPDIVCLQEVRATEDKLRPLEELFSGYRAFWHPAVRPGYAGVAVLTRFEPVGFERGLDGGADPEGRSLTLDFGDFRVGSFYAPNATPGTAKMPIKSSWLSGLERHVSRRSEKPFIVSGDLNVAQSERDSRGEEHPYAINGCTDEERRRLSAVMETCRLHDPIRERAGETVLSTWWHLGSPDRQPENGVRFDYIFVGETERPLVIDSAIRTEVDGSDHCPVTLSINLSLDGLKRATPLGQRNLF